MGIASPIPVPIRDSSRDSASAPARDATPLRNWFSSQPARLERVAALWHLTSLDAPTVAVAWTLAFASAAHVRLPAWVPVLLGLAAWSVYIGDRLLDAQAARSPLRERHYFHWRHRRIFTPLALAAACAALVLIILCMPAAAMFRNGAVATAALTYFVGVHTRKPGSYRAARRLPRVVPKELLVGVIFTVACATPTLARMTASRTQMLPVVLCFTLLAWLNCHAIETWERCQDGESEEPGNILRLGAVLGLACLLASLGMAGAGYARMAWLTGSVAVSAGLLAGLDRVSGRIAGLRLRVAADLVLLVAGIVLFAP